MSNFLIDSLGEQIERGEVFFGSYTGLVQPGIGTYWKIDVGANDTALTFQILTTQLLYVELREDATLSGGSLQTNYNLLRSDTTTTMGTTLTEGATLNVAGSTILRFGYIKPDEGSIEGAVDISKTVILKANTQYSYQVNHIGPNPDYILYSWYLREI